MRKAFVSPWAESVMEIQSVPAGAGRGSLDLGFIEPTYRGFHPVFPSRLEGAQEVQRSLLQTSSGQLPPSTSSHFTVLAPSEPVRTGGTHTVPSPRAPLPSGVGKNAPNPLGPWKWAFREGSRGSDVTLGKPDELGNQTQAPDHSS